MKHTSNKFLIKIKIEDYKKSSYVTIKRNILKQLFPYQEREDYSTYSNYIQDLVTQRVKKTALGHGIQAYVADYEEREGCFEISFLLILETIIVFSHLRHFAEIIKEDVESLFHTTSHDYTVRGHVHEITINRGNNQNRDKIIWVSSSFAGCFFLSILFFYFKANEEKVSVPTKIELNIKLDSSKILLKETNNFTVYKDSLVSNSKYRH